MSVIGNENKSGNKKIVIFPIVGMMVASVVLYVFRVIYKNNYDLTEVIEKSVRSIQIGNTKINSNLMESNNAAVGGGEVLPSEDDNVSKLVRVTSGYSSLNSNEERKFYYMIKNRINEIDEEANDKGFYSIKEIDVPGQKMDAKKIKKVIYAIKNDFPEYFWISNLFSYYYNSSVGNAIFLNSIFSKSQKKVAVEKFNKTVKDIIKKLPENATDFEKEILIHDYIVEKCNYHSGGSGNKNSSIYSAYGCLIDGDAVCEGYSKAMQILLCNAGIECRVVVGTRGSEPHMWNVVKINGNWYHVDATWDGKEKITRYNYFNVTDDVIKKDHTISAVYSDNSNSDLEYSNFQLPKCSAKNENYYERYACKISSKEDLKNETISNKLTQLASRNETIIHLLIPQNISLDAAENILFGRDSQTFFGSIGTANSNIQRLDKEINSREIQYVKFSPQNVLSIKFEYV